MKNVSPFASWPPHTVPQRPCDRCAAQAREIAELRARVTQLTEQNEKLTRAVQRESHYMDERVIRNK